MDYRKLNSFTVRPPRPLPRIDKWLDSLGDEHVFSTLDASSRYWKREVNKTNRQRTAFTSPGCLYQFAMMPFGLKKALATFQRVIIIVLPSVERQFALVYLDDINIFSKTPQEHIAHIKMI